MNFKGRSLMAGPPRFELGIAESKSAELPLLHRPLKIYSFPPILRILSLYFRNYCGGQTAVSIVVSQPLTAACDLGLQTVVSHPLTSIKCVALL